MNRRTFLATAAAGGAVMALGNTVALAKDYFPVENANEALFQGINRIKNPKDETTLEKLHSPVIKAPEKVKAGEPFAVQVTIGEMLHPMGPNHWIEYIQLNIGNEPGGTLFLRSRGYLEPQATFHVKLGDELKGKTISLIVQEKCNLHGLWQSSVNVQVE